MKLVTVCLFCVIIAETMSKPAWPFALVITTVPAGIQMTNDCSIATDSSLSQAGYSHGTATVQASGHSEGSGAAAPCDPQGAGVSAEIDAEGTAAGEGDFQQGVEADAETSEKDGNVTETGNTAGSTQASGEAVASHTAVASAGEGTDTGHQQVVFGE